LMMSRPPLKLPKGGKPVMTCPRAAVDARMRAVKEMQMGGKGAS